MTPARPPSGRSRRSTASRSPASSTRSPCAGWRPSRPVAARPVAQLKVTDAARLTPVTRVLRLNMTNQHVGKLQESLAFLGYPIDAQGVQDLVVRGHDPPGGHRLPAGPPAPRHRPRRGRHGPRAQRADRRRQPPGDHGRALAADQGLGARRAAGRAAPACGSRCGRSWCAATGALLGERPTHARRASTTSRTRRRSTPTPSSPRSRTTSSVKVVDAAGSRARRQGAVQPDADRLGQLRRKATEPVPRDVRAASTRLKLVSAVLGGARPARPRGDATRRRRSPTSSVNTGLSVDDVMRLVVSARVAAAIGAAPRRRRGRATRSSARTCRPRLPSDLLQSTQEWTLIDDARRAHRQRAGVPRPRPAGRRRSTTPCRRPTSRSRPTLAKAAILAALAAARERVRAREADPRRQRLLKALLDASAIPPARYPAVATAFLTHKTPRRRLLRRRPQPAGRLRRSGRGRRLRDRRSASARSRRTSRPWPPA